jgi:uncharacterized protein
MSQRLPDHFDPWRFADLAKRVKGSYLLADLPRLRDCLADQRGEVWFDLEFLRDAQGRACLQGTVETQLKLECQRCLKTMILPVKTELSLAFVAGLDEAEALPDHLDPELVENGLVLLRDMVEDELLLTLPHVPRHPVGECVPHEVKRPPESGGALRENPFSILAQLKKQEN